MASIAHRYRTFLGRHADELKALQEVVALLAMHSGVNPQDAEYMAGRLEGIAKAAENIAASVETMREEEITEPKYVTHDDLPAVVGSGMTEAQINDLVARRVEDALAASQALRPVSGIAQGGNADARSPDNTLSPPTGDVHGTAQGTTGDAPRYNAPDTGQPNGPDVGQPGYAESVVENARRVEDNPQA